ncbi:MAG: cytochrome c biogenesis protein ResB, partial [Elusimicrobiota bacterium]
YIERYKGNELVFIDVSHTDFDEVVSFPESALVEGRMFAAAGLPFRFKVERWYKNSSLVSADPALHGLRASDGIGQSLLAVSQPLVSSDEHLDIPSALITIEDDQGLSGAWLVSTALAAPQTFKSNGRPFAMIMRPSREYLPFSLTLKDFKHDVYPGTTIPKNFSSLVRLQDPEAGQDRDALIYMNNPLRYGGLTFYQSSFGKDDTLSVLQVVRNPGWLLPYLAFVLVGIGLIVHFCIYLFSFRAVV